MSMKQGITQKLLEKIETDLGPEDYKNYQTVFTSFIKGDVSYATYQEKMLEILGMKLLPFHQRFVNLFRKRVTENKSIQKYKSILIRIKEDKKEARLAKLELIRSKKSASVASHSMIR